MLNLLLIKDSWALRLPLLSRWGSSSCRIGRGKWFRNHIVLACLKSIFSCRVKHILKSWIACSSIRNVISCKEVPLKVLICEWTVRLLRKQRGWAYFLRTWLKLLACMNVALWCTLWLIILILSLILWSEQRVLIGIACWRYRLIINELWGHHFALLV